MMNRSAPTTEAVAPDRLPIGWWVGETWRWFKEAMKSPFYGFYLRRLRNRSADWTKPRHLGVIMDGNRRFARLSGWKSPRLGHEKGAEKLHEVLDWCFATDIRVVTVWSFSIENFQRSSEEVADLLRLFEDKTREMADGDRVHEQEVRVRYIGKLELLPTSLREEIARVEKATEHYDQYCLNIAMAYGGREEIAEAFRRWVTDRAQSGDSIEDLGDFEVDMLNPYLYTSGQPEPDLILRTSGEIRMSGFLLWQSAYSEFYFSDANWPSFREIDFLRALRTFDQRQRRFGR